MLTRQRRESRPLANDLAYLPQWANALPPGATLFPSDATRRANSCTMFAARTRRCFAASGGASGRNAATAMLIEKRHIVEH